MTLRYEVGPLDTISQQAVKALAQASFLADGVAPLSEQPLFNLSLDTHEVTHVVVWDRTGTPEQSTPGKVAVGYVQIDRRGQTPSAELVVAPTYRRQGIGSKLLRTAQRDATLPTQSGEPGQHASLRIWAHGFIPEAQEFAAKHALSPVRELWLMARPLDGNQGPFNLGQFAQREFPAGVVVQEFEGERDAQPWLELNRRAFAWHPEQGRMTIADLQERAAEDWFDQRGFFVVRARGSSADGPLLGAVWVKVPTNERAANGTGEIYVLSVNPDAQGRGFGRNLTDLALAYLASLGLARAELWTESNNAPAVATYEKSGFVSVAKNVQLAVSSPTRSASLLL